MTICFSFSSSLFLSFAIIIKSPQRGQHPQLVCNVKTSRRCFCLYHACGAQFLFSVGSVGSVEAQAPRVNISNSFFIMFFLYHICDIAA